MVVSKHHCAIIGSNKSAGLELQAMLSRTKTNDSRVDRVNPRNNNSSPSTDGRQKTHNPHTLSLQYNFVFYELTSTAIGVDEQAEDLAEELEAFKHLLNQIQCFIFVYNPRHPETFALVDLLVLALFEFKGDTDITFVIAELSTPEQYKIIPKSSGLHLAQRYGVEFYQVNVNNTELVDQFFLTVLATIVRKNSIRKIIRRRAKDALSKKAVMKKQRRRERRKKRMEEKRARRERREKREREAAMKKNKAVRQTTTLGGESEMNTKAEKTMGVATGRQGCTRKMVRGGEGVTEVTRSDSNTDGRGTETETDADTDTDMDDDHDDDDDVNIDEESDIDDDGDDDGIFAPQKDITSLLVIIVIICFLFYNLTAYRSGQR